LGWSHAGESSSRERPSQRIGEGDLDKNRLCSAFHVSSFSSSHDFVSVMSTLFIDETAGSDDTGNGTAEAPYQTLAFAFFTAGDPPPTLRLRKDPNTEWDEPTQSALKKARKGAEGLEKKKKRAAELAERDAGTQAAERERKERALEESKKIVLTEDASLPKAKTVSVRRDRRVSVLLIQDAGKAR
jgi:hypothetical protein